MRAEVLEKARKDPRGTPARILDAAEEVFAEQGFSGASTREMARRARVPFGAMHYHWGSKRQLFQAVCQRMIERTRETLIGNLQPGNTPGQIMDNMTDAFVDILVGNRNHARLVYRGCLDDPRDPIVEGRIGELVQFGLGIFSALAPGAKLDAEMAIFLISKAFVAAIVDEPFQERVLGGSVFENHAARERLRAGLRRLARVTFEIGE
jgi:AcrR family transcriptional regulator